MPRSGSLSTPRSRRLTGPGFGRRWPGSSFGPSMAAPQRCPRIDRADREEFTATAQTVAVMTDVLPGEVGVNLGAVADPAVAAAIERAHQAAVTRRAELHRAACPVHPDRAPRDPAGQRPWPARGRVHPSRQSGRRPGSAHPRRGREQGPNPRQPVAIHRRSGVVQGQGCRVGDLQHLPGAASSRRVGGALRCPVPAPIRASGRSGKLSASTSG